jgi:predicted protein tyrosine phosphatase
MIKAQACKRQHVLFICTYNRWRSLTAEKLFASRPGLIVKSAGISPNARVRVTTKLIAWADLIFVMEPRHLHYLNEMFFVGMTGKHVVCLNIPSGYRYNDPELIELLELGVKASLHE